MPLMPPNEWTNPKGGPPKKMPIPSIVKPFDYNKKKNPSPMDNAMKLYKRLFPGAGKKK